MKVYVQKGSDEVKTTIEILRKAKPKIKNKILIKPNLTMPFSPKTAICTSPQVVEGIIKYLQDLGIKDIVIGEGSGATEDMSEIFEIIGYNRLSKKYNIPLVNLNRDKPVRLKITNGRSLKYITVANSILDRYIINVPKMKTHRLTEVTLAMKNMV
ncbi:MAG: DUF362 domain-containing protein, partial [Candidatus Thorarchaeota archaeon]